MLHKFGHIIQGSGEAQSCSFEKTYVVIYDLDVLPQNPEIFVTKYEEAQGLLQGNFKKLRYGYNQLSSLQRLSKITLKVPATDKNPYLQVLDNSIKIDTRNGCEF